MTQTPMQGEGGSSLGDVGKSAVMVNSEWRLMGGDDSASRQDESMSDRVIWVPGGMGGSPMVTVCACVDGLPGLTLAPVSKKQNDSGV
jgi:hypothetical protein